MSDDVIEQLEAVAPWGWEFDRGRCFYHSSGPVKIDGGPKRWFASGFGSDLGPYPTPVGALKAALAYIDEGIAGRAEQVSTQSKRLVRARAALGDLGALLAVDGEDVAADLIRGHLAGAGVALSWEGGCTVCGGRRWLPHAVGEPAHMVFLWPCPLCGEPDAGPETVSTRRGHQVALHRVEGGAQRIASDDTRWCPELEERDE